MNVGYAAILIRIYDGTPDLKPDGVGTGTNPQAGSETTFTECGSFLPPHPFPMQTHGRGLPGGRQRAAAAPAASTPGGLR